MYNYQEIFLNFLVNVSLQYELRWIKEKVRWCKSYVRDYKAVYVCVWEIVRALRQL